jgi:hypothetical protein
MDDLFYLSISIVLLALTWGLVKMCEVLQPETERRTAEKSGEKV